MGSSVKSPKFEIEMGQMKSKLVHLGENLLSVQNENSENPYFAMGNPKPDATNATN